MKMDLGGIMLCEISQTEKDRYHMILLILFFTLKKNEHTKQNRNKFIDTQNSLVVTRGEGGCRWAKWVKGVSCMVTDDSWTYCAYHCVVYTDVKL